MVGLIVLALYAVKFLVLPLLILGGIYWIARVAVRHGVADAARIPADSLSAALPSTAAEPWSADRELPSRLAP